MGDNNKTNSGRIGLIRDAATLQVKLLVDGFRDALLIPVSLIATVIGVLRGGDEPDREFKRVVELGRRSERWINLFGRHDTMDMENPTGTIDKVLEQAEAVVIEQYKKGRPPTGDVPDKEIRIEEPEPESNAKDL